MKNLDDMRRETALPVIIADHQGLVIYVNSRFESVFGWTADEIRGKPLTVVIPKQLHDAHHLGFSRFIMTGQPTLLNRPLPLKAITKAGIEMDCEHFIIAEKSQGQWVFAATLKP